MAIDKLNASQKLTKDRLGLSKRGFQIDVMALDKLNASQKLTKDRLGVSKRGF
jgi:hypothetical protein